MKVTKIAAAAVAAMSVLAGCASTSSTSSASVAPAVERPVTIEWQGSAYGTNIPDWVVAVGENNLPALNAMTEYSGKVPKVATSRGQDLDLLRAWVQADAAGELSRGINQSITTTLGNVLSGSKDADAATVKVTNEAIGIFSSNVISGFEKSREFWVKLRHPDGKEEYEYLVIFAIDKDNLTYQVDKALGKVSAASEKEKDALAEIDRLVKESAMKVEAF